MPTPLSTSSSAAPAAEALSALLDGHQRRCAHHRGRRLRRLRVTLHRALRLPPMPATARLFSGTRLRVVLPELVAAELYVAGLIEAGITRTMIDRLRPGDAVVDVGAQYGYHAALAARLVGETGSVHAFEPTPRSHGLLARNLAHLRNVVVEPMALGDGDGVAILRDFGPRHSAVNTLQSQARVPEGERRALRPRLRAVPRCRLDDYARARGLRPSFVKIDAEGSELSVLRGARRVLEECAPVVSIETGDYGGEDEVPTRRSVDYLLGLGYRCVGGMDLACADDPGRPYGYGNLVFERAAVPGGTSGEA
jgi:FkbM family methyltransferase